VSASNIRLKDTLRMHFGQTQAATEKQIAGIVTAFVDAAVFLSKADWDGIQLHAAHGYLLAQFLSPTTNTRTDRYGGSFENRARIVLDIILAIRAQVLTTFIISLKINSVEFQEGGFSIQDAADLCTLLEHKASVDFVELSGGTYEELAFDHKRESTKKREAFFLLGSLRVAGRF
jgi:2,4-dienoyl-CoA reductase-like NADH-dependent reductase (Old Yellow Enzyme family)